MAGQVEKALRMYKSFIVTMHVNPDPDAVCSAMAMALFLRSRGKKVRLFNADPCPRWLDFLPRVQLYEQYRESEHSSFVPDAIVVLDSGDLGRIGQVARAAVKGVRIVNIDHHVTNARFGHYNLVRDRASSTSEMLWELFKREKYRMTRDVAMLLYLGILTDTGSFGFDCTSARTHEAVAGLLRFKFSVSDLYRRVYETLPRQDLKPFLSFMNRLELFCDDQVACLSIKRRDVEFFCDDFDLKDKVFTFLRAVKGLKVIVLLTELEKGKVRVNFRSRGALDVAKLAGKFKGGGHRNASGGFVDGDMPAAKARVLAAVKKEL
jgi:phosphoesterase RecJ-like protein